MMSCELNQPLGGVCQLVRGWGPARGRGSRIKRSWCRPSGPGGKNRWLGLRLPCHGLTSSVDSQLLSRSRHVQPPRSSHLVGQELARR